MAVHRYKADESDSKSKSESKAKKTAPKKAAKTTAAKKAVMKEKVVKEPKKNSSPLGKFSDYFVGSWRELRQVRWPNRAQTWALTLAVIIFSLALGAMIFLLDLGFTYLFKQVIF